jgi:hypothetical protein
MELSGIGKRTQAREKCKKQCFAAHVDSGFAPMPIRWHNVACYGSVAERLKAPVLKTGEGVSPS